MNQKADSYYLNSELVDLEPSNLVNSSQSVLRIILTLTDTLLNSSDTPVLGVTCTNYSFGDTPALNINET